VQFRRIALVALIPLALIATLSGATGAPTSTQSDKSPQRPLKAPLSLVVLEAGFGEALAAQDAAWHAQYAVEEAERVALAEAARVRVSPVPTAPQTQTGPRPSAPQAAAPSGGGDCGGVNQYAAFIYSRESGCNPSAMNAGGCRGIGQACPGSKLPCGADFACQHAWFESYGLSRYGSWAAAYQFWLANHWW
jgi:hypothetical protein